MKSFLQPLKFPKPRTPGDTLTLVAIMKAMHVWLAPLRDLYPPLITLPPVPRPVITSPEPPLQEIVIVGLNLE